MNDVYYVDVFGDLKEPVIFGDSLRSKKIKTGKVMLDDAHLRYTKTAFYEKSPEDIDNSFENENVTPQEQYVTLENEEKKEEFKGYSFEQDKEEKKEEVKEPYVYSFEKDYQEQKYEPVKEEPSYNNNYNSSFETAYGLRKQTIPSHQESIVHEKTVVSNTSAPSFDYASEIAKMKDKISLQGEGKFEESMKYLSGGLKILNSIQSKTYEKEEKKIALEQEMEEYRKETEKKLAEYDSKISLLKEEIVNNKNKKNTVAKKIYDGFGVAKLADENRLKQEKLTNNYNLEFANLKEAEEQNAKEATSIIESMLEEEDDKKVSEIKNDTIISQGKNLEELNSNDIKDAIGHIYSFDDILNKMRGNEGKRAI